MNQEQHAINRREFLKYSALGTLCATELTSAPATMPAESTRPARFLAIPPVVSSEMATPAYLLPDLAPAQWIWYPGYRVLANTVVLFRRSLRLDAPPVRARGWIIGESRYRLEVNGQRVQYGPAPSDPRFVEVDPLDLTSILKTGENVIGATVLFFGYGDGTWPIGKAGFLFWLEIEYAGGRMDKIVSDARWQTHLCRAWPPGQFQRFHVRALQEEFDARLYPHGWTRPEYQTDQNWLPARDLKGSPNRPAIFTAAQEYISGIRPTGEGELRPRSIPLLHEIKIPAKRLAESFWLKWLRSPREYFECYPPDSFKVAGQGSATVSGEHEWTVSIEGPDAAALTFGFEEQIVGFPYFTIEAPAGTVVEVLYQEGHRLGGPALLDRPGFSNWTRFICREGSNDFECIDYESLMWLQLHIHGQTGRIVVRNVGVRRRVFPWPNEPVLRTNEAPLQRLFDAGVNSLCNSAQETCVDGMGRERQQYAGDCSHQQQAIRLVFGETRLPRRFLTTFSQGLTTSGYFLDCWPAWDRLKRAGQKHFNLFHFGTILDHGVQFIFDCWLHYMQTGDLEAVREPYPRLLRFANYLHSTMGEDGLLAVEDLGLPFVWMDYEAYGQRSGVFPPGTQRRKKCAYNLYVAAAFRHALAPLCRVFGHHEQASSVDHLGRKLEAATVRRFWSAEHHMFINNLPWLAEEGKRSICDRSLATAILFDQCPGGDSSACAGLLAEPPPDLVLSYPSNAGWRLWALGKAGRADIILKDFRERWATMKSVIFNNGMPEHWTPKEDSLFQWSFCSVAPLYITYQCLAGIRPLEPGYRRVELRPQVGDLEQLELVLPTPHGPLRFEARGTSGARDLRIELPAKCEGELVVDPREVLSLAPGAAKGRFILPPGRGTSIRLKFT